MLGGNGLSLVDEIECIETTCTRDYNWYYHCIGNDVGRVENILTEGIKCRKRLGKKGGGCNGKDFISLSKDICVDGVYSAFHSFRKWFASIIIDNIDAYKCIDVDFIPVPIIHLLANTRLPIRFSGFHDEFQAYKIIEPDKYVGLQFPLYLCTKEYEESKNDIFYLELLKNVIIVMKQFECRLPLYDYSRIQGNSVHQINLDDFLMVYDRKISNLTSEEKRLLLKR